MQQVPPVATTNHARMTDGVVCKRPRVNLVSDALRSVNTRMDLSPKQTISDQPRVPEPAERAAPTAPGSEFEQMGVEKRLADLQSRLRKRGVKVRCPPKRRRVSDIGGKDDNVGLAHMEKRKRILEGAGGNGRVVACTERKEPMSLWERLTEAAIRLAEQKRPDPRFISGRRPLDCLDGLRVSIGVTLFPDGYSRHDGIERKRGDSGGFVRYPYDRNSREFLRCLDLGLIPTEEDLPEVGKRYYYDGCLVAEVKDLRLGDRAESPVRVLLRPNMASLYADIEMLTTNLDKTAAAAVEEKLIKAIAPPVDCAPRVASRRLSSALDTSIYSTTYAFNVGRRPKRRRISRPAGPPTQPRLSTAALLLISEADKQQTMHWYAQQGVRAALTSPQKKAAKQGTGTALQGLVPNVAIPTASNVVGVNDASADNARYETGGMTSAASVTAPSWSGGVTAGKEGLNGKRLVRKPPQMLMTLRPEKATSMLGSSKGAAPLSREKQEHLQTAQFILPDQQARLAFEKAKAQMEVARTTKSPEIIRSAEYTLQRVKLGLKQAGRQMYSLELIRSSRGIEIQIVRWLSGEKDAIRVNLPSEDSGKSFLDQFKMIMKKEGFVCMQEISPNEGIAHQRGQQIRAPQQQMKQSGGGTARQQANPISTGIPQNQNPTQAAKFAAPLSFRSTQSLPQGNSTQPQLLQLRKQNFLQRQQLQRQRQQQNAQIPITGQHHLQHVSPVHQQPHIPNNIHNPQQQVALPHAPQHQLPQAQHPAPLTFQQQFLQQHLHQRELQHQLQQHQNARRARRMDQQIQRHVKNAGNLQQPAAGRLGANGRGGQILSKGAAGLQGNVTTIGRGGSRVPTGGLNSSAMGNMGSSGLLGHNQILTPAQLQQLRTQHLRAQEQHRTMLAAVGGADMNGPFPRNGNIASGNPMSAHHFQTQALAAVMGGGAVPSGAGFGVSAGDLTGADPLTNQRLHQHFKQQSQTAQQRDNVEAQSRSGKR